MKYLNPVHWLLVFLRLLLIPFYVLPNNEIEDLQEIFDLLKDVEKLEDKRRTLKRRAEQLKVPDPLKRAYTWHDLHIQENVDKMSDQLFRGIMRMDRDCFDAFASEIEYKFPKLGLSPHGHNITPRERLYILLNFLSGDTHKHHGSWTFKCCISCHRESIDMALNVIFDHMVPIYISLPTPEEARKQALLFRDRSGYRPNAWAAIDGTHIKVHTVIFYA